MRRAIIILGSPNDDRGSLSPVALARLDIGFQEYRSRPDAAVLLTGGFGPRFNNTARPHADYAREYLAALGVPADAFLDPALSSNTVQDAFLAKSILARGKFDRAVLVTSDFHLERARYIFARLVPDLRIEYRPAPAPQSDGERAASAAHEREALAALRTKGISWEGRIYHQEKPSTAKKGESTVMMSGAGSCPGLSSLGC